MSIRGTNKKLIHCFEQLKLVDSEQDASKKESLLRVYGSMSPMSYILSMNFNPSIKIDLPSGMPSTLNLDTTVHEDMRHPLHTQIARMRNCFVDAKIPKIKKEKVFLDIIEAIPFQDVEVLVAAKDKMLTELYPTITKELVAKAFPNYVS